MRHAAGRRNRNRGGQRPRGPSANRGQVFDSNGPYVRIRGTAYQIVEKYAALAKDAASIGDRVLAENYLQHAEHYQRIISTWAEDVRPAAFSSSDGSAPENDADEVSLEIRPVNMQKNREQDDDLSLPVSILGGIPSSMSQASATERTGEYTA